MHAEEAAGSTQRCSFPQAASPAHALHSDQRQTTFVTLTCRYHGWSIKPGQDVQDIALKGVGAWHTACEVVG